MAEAMKIEEIFRLAIDRSINKVVKVSQEDEDIVRQELEEYILTSSLEDNYREILENIRETEDAGAEEVGIWISGFFGSGKSHFMKILGYLLENNKLPDGSYPIEKFKQRTHDEMLKGIVDKVDSLFDSEVLMFQIGSKENKREADSITEIVLREFNRKRGFSATPWVAEIEKSLKKEGYYQDFKEKIKENRGESWKLVRTEAAFVRKVIEKTLVEVVPDFETKEDAKNAIRDAEDDLIINPENLAKEINNYIKQQNSGKNKRFFVFLDEISQFIGDDKEKLLELQSITEEFKRVGNGKIWLGVTSQEELKELVPGILAMEKEVSKVMDRFPHRVNLTPEEIDKIVRERVLKKKESAHKELMELFDNNEGLLSSSYKIDSSRKLKEVNENNFTECYPFLPYQIDILPSIFGGLRGEVEESQITGRERTMIGVIHSIFNEPINFKEKDIGHIVPMNIIFDEIQGEIKDEDVSAIQNVSLEDVDDELAKKVLKTLYLLQQLDWIPNSPENICTGLFTTIGDTRSLEKEVKKVLKKLREAAYVDETEEGYRFLSQTERNLMEEIESVEVRPGDVKRRTKKVLQELFEDITPIQYGGNSSNLFDLTIKADDQEITTKGDINLLLMSPIYQLTDDVDLRTLKTGSHGSKENIYWLADPEEKESLETELERLMKSETVLNNKRGENLSPEEQKAIENKADDVARLKRDIKKGFKKAFQRGTMIYYGDEYELDDTSRDLEKCISKITDQVVPRVYPKLEDGLADVKDKDIERVLKDIEISSLPAVFEELNLIVNDELNTEAPICKEINTEIQQNNELSGKEILNEFEGKPYGWSRNVIRLGVAILFRNGEIIPRYQEKRYPDFKAQNARNLFTSIRKFRSTIFEEQESISPEKRKNARDLLDKLFDKRVSDTVPDVKNGILEALEDKSEEYGDLLSKLENAGFPLSDKLVEVRSHLNSIRGKQIAARIIKSFLDKEEELTDLAKSAEKIVEFEEDGKLEKYRIFKNFVKDDWNKLEDLGERTDLFELEDDMKDAAERLETTLESKEVMDNWADAQTDHQKIARKYVETYKKLYSKRHKVYSDAIQEVKEYGDDLEDEELEETLRDLEERKGEETIEIDISKGEHVGLKPGIKRINEHIRTVDTYKEDAKKLVDDRLSRGENGGVKRYTIPISSTLSGEVVKEEEDVERVLALLEEKVKEKLEEDEEVEIRFR